MLHQGQVVRFNSAFIYMMSANVRHRLSIQCLFKEMALILPTTLSGDSLGERHRRLNLQVNEAATAGQVSAQDIEGLTEQTAVDRLIKIDIAIKLKNVDYIVKSLKDDDMLRMLKKRKYCSYMEADCLQSECIRVKSELQKLFDEFRIVGFNGTLHELRGRINAVSSADRRRDILLVLVSKSGGRPECVRLIMELALRFRNEPVHQRATIVRSLVKRASAWRLPQDVWDSMFEYGQGLGLDGTRSEAQCREGLHAVVLRQLLTTGDCAGAVRTAFLKDFSTLEEYKLTTAESSTIAAGLQHILTSAARDAKPEVSASYLDRLLHVFEKYRIPFNSVVADIKTLADRDSEVARSLLQRLYKARVGRLERPNVKLARPLATLAGKNMESIIQEQDLAGKEHHKLAAALRANIHRARPAPNALTLGWRKAGMKAVAWRAIRCRPSEVTQLIQTLLQERVKRTVRLVLVLAQRTTCVADIFATAVTIRPLAALRAALPYYRILGEAADPRVYDIVKPYIASVDLTTRQGLRRVLKNYNWLPVAIKPEYCAVLCLILDKVADGNAGDVRRYLMTCLPQVSEDLLKNVLTVTLTKVDASDPESFPAIVIRYLMLSKSDEEEKSRYEQIGQPFLKKITAFRQGDDDLRSQFFNENLDQIMSSLQYNAAFFDMKSNHCLVVIERVLAWLSNVLTKETHFEEYAKIHATMLYYKAIRQSMKQKPEIFADPAKKLSEGVDIVGFTFGRYIVKEMALLKSKYFDSVIELYNSAFTDYLGNYFLSGTSKGKFIAALTKGMLSESVGSEARLAVHVLQTCQYNLEGAVKQEINELCLKKEDKEMALIPPTTLQGDSLGERHRRLNLQVNQAATAGQVSAQDIEGLTEQTAVDRLIKIDIAIKLKNVDYIVKSLKDDDMLYVSRALKYNELVKRYLKDEQVFYKSIIFLLKSDPEVFLDITEKYHNLTTQSKLKSPVVKNLGTTESHVFDDQDYEPIVTNWYLGYERMSMVMKCCDHSVVMCDSMESDDVNHRTKSELEKLFDEFRFVGFNGTLHELRGRINAVSSADRRRDMLLVLVSKSGGRSDCVREMLQFALRLRNEPVHQRATIVRSLVKRANVWRLPQDVWDSMLEYGQGLGLDGTRSEAQCREGLHAVVLRQLLTTGDCVGAVRSAFLEDFSTLEEYKLNTAERATIADGLQNILTSAASDAKPEVSASYLDRLLDVFEKYRISFNSVVAHIKTLADRDSEVARSLLQRLYKARVGRLERPNVKLARPLATLAGKNIESIIQEQDLAGKEHHKLAAALRANIHRARPAPDALALGWRKIGMKAVAWRAIRCRPSEVTQLIQTLLQERVKRTVRLALVLAQRTTCVADIFSVAVTIRPLAALRAALPYYRILGEAADPRVYDIVKPHIASLDLTSRHGLRRVLKNYDWLPVVMKPEYCALLCLILDKVADGNAGDVRRYLMTCLPQVGEDLLKNLLTETLNKVDDDVSFPAIVIRYLMLSESDDEEKSRFEQIGQPFLEKITSFHQGDDEFRGQYFKENLDQIMSSLQYNAAFFDMKYNHCLVVIERVLAWLSNVLTKETHFEEYAKIHATMLYYKAIRQSMKQKPEIFDDPVKKQTEGVDVVGSTFGRYIVKEVALLKSNYFDSVMELYRNAFTDYLSSYFVSGASKGKFIAALIKCMLSESVGSEARLAVHILETCQYNLEDAVKEEIIELCLESEDNEVMFFMHAEIFA
ncbi:unnamed protein product [Arctia plantaginis]|uniref:Uncharacterized protein n=1 Tax=Arctia plantaginis TaxID=874455 RepID=A0A8S0ZWH9_ARCPL|nr:unnamed protein product [Arctia plantaginis]